MSVPTPGEPVRAFLDANVLYAAAIGGGCVKLWNIPTVTLVTSEYAAKEAWDNLQREDDPRACRERLCELLHQIEVHPHDEDGTRPLFSAWALPDPKDVPILMGAIEHDCQYVLTGDGACFGEFFGRALDGVTILRPGKFLGLLGL